MRTLLKPDVTDYCMFKECGVVMHYTNFYKKVKTKKKQVGNLFSTDAIALALHDSFICEHLVVVLQLYKAFAFYCFKIIDIASCSRYD